ncbi:MAG: hypothetical protein IJT68_01320, partial [Lentisphaeria bacterium]|nr:hypothetical protein [Lentisphaeria bacterium]
AIELREKYFKASSNAEKDKIRKELHELIAGRFDTYNRSAERQIAETEEVITSAQERLAILKKQHEERVKNADIFIDSTVADYLNPDRKPTYEEALRKRNEQDARNKISEDDSNGRNGRGGQQGGGRNNRGQQGGASGFGGGPGGMGGGFGGGFGGGPGGMGGMGGGVPGIPGAGGMGGFGGPGFGGPPTMPQSNSRDNK